MMQRGMIWQNEQIGAFEGEEYYGGRTNPYQRYYAQMQARQAEFQRARFLNAQRFQNNYMLQQQKAQDIQFAEEQEVERNKQEMERQLAFVSSELDALENNPEIDKSSWEYKARRQQHLDDKYKLQTGLDRNTPQVHEEDSGFTKTVIDPETGDKKEVPIMSRFILDKDDKPIYHVQGKEVATNQLERDKFEQAKIDAARKANHDEKVLEETKFNNQTARLKERNAQRANELKAANQSNSSMDKKLEVADKLEERKKESATKRREKINEWYRLQKSKIETTDEQFDQKVGKLEEDRFNDLEEFDQKEALDEWRGDPDDVPADMTPTYRPTRGEVGDEIRRRNLLNKDDPTEDELNEQVQYDSPMDPEFSDEQFAGTEPAGLYDPTGQPLPMDGGMYNGFA
tara:strand:- start:2051 stop:3250 length:1200 start_codon:yes stop_codon:yes gene_type:complete